MEKLSPMQIKLNVDSLNRWDNSIFTHLVSAVLYQLLQGKQGFNELVKLLNIENDTRPLTKALEILKRHGYIVLTAVHTVIKRGDYSVTAKGENMRELMDSLIASSVVNNKKP